MKLKLILSLALFVVASSAFSQNSQLRRGKSSYEKYSDVKALGSPQLGINDLMAADKALERAINHDRTKDLAETWVYYSLTKADIALIDTTEVGITAHKAALEGRERAIQLDTDQAQAENIEVLNFLLAQYELNEGVVAWEKEDFKTAYEAFERGEKFIPGDTTLLFYAGLAAVQAQDYKKALSKYEQLVPIDSFSNNQQIILDVSRMLVMEGDTAKAIHYANLGREKYPENSEVVNQFIELNLMAGNEKEVISTIQEQTVREPNNRVLHYYLGLAYDAAGDAENAEAAYRNALNIDPNYVEANINLGGLILNRGIEMWNATNNKRDLTQAQYDAELAEAHKIFDQALPYLQRAVDADGSNFIALSNLQRYYQIKDDQAKVDEIQARLDALN